MRCSELNIELPTALRVLFETFGEMECLKNPQQRKGKIKERAGWNPFMQGLDCDFSGGFWQVQRRLFVFKRNNALCTVWLFPDGGWKTVCYFRCISFIKSSKSQFKQGEAFPFPTHIWHDYFKISGTLPLTNWRMLKSLKLRAFSLLWSFQHHSFWALSWIVLHCCSKACKFFSSSQVFPWELLYIYIHNSAVQESCSKMCLSLSHSSCCCLLDPSAIC